VVHLFLSRGSGPPSVRASGAVSLLAPSGVESTPPLRVRGGRILVVRLPPVGAEGTRSADRGALQRTFQNVLTA
jgi:hypothetical protein